MKHGWIVALLLALAGNAEAQTNVNWGLQTGAEPRTLGVYDTSHAFVPTGTVNDTTHIFNLLPATPTVFGGVLAQTGYSASTGLGSAANYATTVFFSGAGIFNVRDYGSFVGTGGNDDAAFTAAENAACAWAAASSGSNQTSRAIVYGPTGFQYSLAVTHNLNCNNSYEMLGQVNSSVSNGAAFVINSVLPGANQNQLAGWHFASCLQTNGNSSFPTGINTSGGMCVEIRNMQFAKYFHLDNASQFTYTPVYFNCSNDHYTGQNIQQNMDVYLGKLSYNGMGFKMLSYSGGGGACNANFIRWADMTVNYQPFQIDDATHFASSSNTFSGSIETAQPLETTIPAVNYSYWNNFYFTYLGFPVTFGAGATGNFAQAQNNAATGAVFTDSSGNASNCMLPGGLDYKYALAACLGGYFPASSISFAAVAFGAGSINQSWIANYGNFSTGINVQGAGLTSTYGSTSVAGTAVWDWRTSGLNSTYDCQMQFFGGNATQGNGSATFNCNGGYTFNGRVYAPGGVQTSVDLVTASLPTVSSCGTSPPAASAGSSPNGGAFTLGTGTVTACTVTYATAFPAYAFPTVTPASSYTGTYYLSGVSKTGFTLNLSVSAPGATFTYSVHGN